MDNLLLSVMIILVIVLITAFLLARARRTRAAGEDLLRRQRLDYQPMQKPIVVTPPAPVARPNQKFQPPAPVPAIDLETCPDLRQCLVALTGKYSLDSFTIASPDGLVIASSGGETAQEDAANCNGIHAGTLPGSIILFGMDHKGSKLTGIIRTTGTITGETKSRIENDTKDILDKWV